MNEQYYQIPKHTRQIAGKYSPLIPINTIGIERREKTNENKKTFVHKQFAQTSANYFDVMLELNISFRSETPQGLVSIPISIKDGN